MSNLSKLAAAGLIGPNATFTAADQAVLDSLSDAEVNALISIKNKLPADFMQRHAQQQGASGAQLTQSTQSIGIVF